MSYCAQIVPKINEKCSFLKKIELRKSIFMVICYFIKFNLINPAPATI